MYVPFSIYNNQNIHQIFPLYMVIPLMSTPYNWNTDCLRKKIHNVLLTSLLHFIYCVLMFKGACSEIFGKLIFFKQADMVTFPTNISTMVKTLQICISFVSNLRKQYLCYLLFYKWWKPRFLISKRVFRWFLPNYTDFAHTISHMKPSKYDSTFGTKISICLKKVVGMRLWIGTSTFNTFLFVCASIKTNYWLIWNHYNWL